MGGPRAGLTTECVVVENIAKSTNFSELQQQARDRGQQTRQL